MLEPDASHPRVRLVAAPKPGGARWISILEPWSAAAYAEAVGAVAPCIEASLSDAVAANRVLSTPNGLLRLEPWTRARRRFLVAVRRRTTACGAVLLADVRNCYPSIGPALVGERLRAIGGRPADAERVADVLTSFTDDGVRGLPIGPEPSAVLANAVLATADEAVADAGASHVRWVDDFVVFATDEWHAVRVLARLRDALEPLGLALSMRKTRILNDPRAIATWLSSSGVSGTGARYHRRADAHPLPRLHGAHPRAPADGGVDPRGRQAR